MNRDEGRSADTGNGGDPPENEARLDIQGIWYVVQRGDMARFEESEGRAKFVSPDPRYFNLLYRSLTLDLPKFSCATCCTRLETSQSSQVEI